MCPNSLYVLFDFEGTLKNYYDESGQPFNE
jgi:hypothetical protein